jgi:hypothetical protein
MRLTVEQDGDVKVRIGPEPIPGEEPSPDMQLETLLNFISWRSPVLEAVFTGTIPTPDANWTPHYVQLELRLADGTLRGQASAQTPDTGHYRSLHVGAAEAVAGDAWHVSRPGPGPCT